MSGDVQPRKRKDKRKKRDDRKSEGDVSIPRHPSFQDDVDDASSHGVHITKMGNEDIHLHVQHQHGTGGHWCAKIIFFALMAVLLGLVGLIIMENRGLEDLDTPLSESRYSNYFDGWVEEHRHEDQHDAHPSHEAAVDDHDAEHDDEHDDEHDEEYEQQTGEDEEEEEEAEEEHDDEDEDEGENTAAENITAEDDEDDNDNDDEASPEPTQSAAYDEEDDDVDDEEDEEDADEIEESIEPPVSQSKTQSAPETAEDDDEEDEEEEAYEDEDIEEPAVSQSQPETAEDQNEDDIDEDADENDDEDIEESAEPIAESAPNAADNDDKDDNDDDDDFDQMDKDDDDDDDFESLDQDVDNDAEEELLLQERQRQAAAAEQAKQQQQQQQQQEQNEEEVPTTTSWLGSLAVKFGVGIALALVSRLVLIRKNPNTNDEDQPTAEINMRRRLTIATAEEAIPEDGLEELPPLDDEIKPREPTGAQAVEHDDDDDLFEQELRKANAEMINENYVNALRAFNTLTHTYAHKPAAHLERAQAVELMAERQHSNRLLLDAIESYKRYLAFDELIANHSEYRAAAERCIEKLRFLGHMQQAVAIHEQLIERFPTEAEVRNQLSLTHLMSNNLRQLQSVAGETLKLWPRNPVANLHYGLALKQLRGDYARAVPHLQHAIDSQANGTQEPYFYLALGECLQRLGQQAEALKIYQRGAEKRFFASVYQRSLYNEPKLRAKPFWQPAETGYARELEQLQRNWRHIRKEALSLLSGQDNFQQEAEQLRDTGNWQQYELYAQGKRLQRNCQRAPITCALIEKFPACSRGQIKFSAMQAQTHVWPHCGPTNCRLRAHLTLVAPEPLLTSLRVAEDQRTWREGDLFIFDDSFEHEVWHNGTQLRLVLIIDIWHPDLSAAQRNNLTPI